MRVLGVVAVVGRVVLLFALMLLVPLLFARSNGDDAEWAFIGASAVTLVVALLMSVPTRRHRRELQPRDGFLLVGLIWLVLPLLGALPLWLALPGLSVTDAVFEATSAFTATGATVMSGLEHLPLSINVWRCFLQLIGGLGIVVLAVAILPLLGVGGSQLFKTEITGPMKDQKLTPRIADTARAIWVIYVLIAGSCLLAYRLAGMSWIDAFLHMCSTVSLGGLSRYDASFAHWNSPLIEAVAVFFMLLSGINLALYFVAWRARSLWVLWRNTEVQAFVLVLLLSIVLVAAYLGTSRSYPDFSHALRHTVFQVVSVATTTGYTTVDYAQWPTFVPLLLLLLACFATCAGSTGGGIKMVRMLLLLKQSRRELVRIVHPQAVTPVVLGGAVVSDRVMHSVIAFMMMYGATLVMLTMLMVFSGLDVLSAFTAVVACLNNVGPGLGAVGPGGNYAVLTDAQSWICTAAMVLGRLELLAVLVLFTPSFWRR